jgi:sulfotransferase family protein
MLVMNPRPLTATRLMSWALFALPRSRKHRFRVIFMNRAIEEVAASQQRFRQRLSGGDVPDHLEMASRLRQHRDRMLDLLRKSANVRLCEVDYEQLLETPDESLQRVIEFAGLNSSALTAMRAVIDPKLRHFTSDKRSQSIASLG